MSVKLRRGHWEVDRKWPDGSRFRHWMPSPRKAEEIDIRIKSAIIDGAWRRLRRLLLQGKREKAMGFRELSEHYLTDYVASHNRSSENKKGRINRLMSVFGNLPIDLISLRQVNVHVRQRKRKGVSNSTINRDLSVLKHMLGWAAKQEYVSRRRVAWIADMEKLREIVAERPRATDEILDAIFAKLDPRVVPLFTFIRETGCRREEALSLRHHQIDWKRAEVTFSGNTKSGKARTVPLTEEAMKAIESMPRIAETDYVFYHPESLTRWDECRKPWQAATEAAGYPNVWIKDMRAAFAIKLAEAGTPMHFIQEMLGHSKIDLTQKRYARFSPQSASDSVRQKLELLRGGKVAPEQAAV